MITDEINTTGWDAIDRALKIIYGDLEPKHWGPILHYRIGGRDPLDGISAYPVSDPPHWHFITYGMTELYDKEFDLRDQSGWGFEFTFRLARKKEDVDPPSLALNFLQNIARYVYGSGNVFDAGHALTLNGPIAIGEKTEIEGILIVRDPQLSETQESPNGKFSFLQIVGITEDEHEFLGEWNARRFAELLTDGNPLLVTDLARKSLLTDKMFAQKVRSLAAVEGSSRAVSFTDKLSWTNTSGVFCITLGALTVSKIVGVLRGRLNFGRSFMLVGKAQSVHFEPSETNAININGSQLNIELTTALATTIAKEVIPKCGVYSWPELGGLIIKVEPSEIWDEKRTKVVSVIG